MDYTSPEFDIQKIASYTLLIQSGISEHHLAVVDDDGNLVLLTVFDLRNVHAQAADLLSAAFEKVRIVYPQHTFTFIPDEVYDQRHLADYAPFISEGLNSGELLVSEIAPLSVQNVYAAAPIAYHEFSSRFPHAQIIPDTTVILSVAGGNLVKKQGLYLGVDIRESRLILYCFNKGQFLFYNTFEIADENDFNYHLLHVVSALGLSWDSIQCVLSGRIAWQDSYYKVIAKYTERIEFADTARLSRVALPESLEAHQYRYLTLMGLYACE